ncbi:hypothetical protein K466DRAFT_392313 [Polyporus arcularius HHB13444]|uniref:Uncharacterized protein n=1 Tax=Polyporus arcularius HHB13444 TaxID=1314778 RepID=A0A5C3NRH3_9APHY|nr:hypothetical protein K466DRAFT_392313 [Polyporus arcularius HHB13444]
MPQQSGLHGQRVRISSAEREGPFEPLISRRLRSKWGRRSPGPRQRRAVTYRSMLVGQMLFDGGGRLNLRRALTSAREAAAYCRCKSRAAAACAPRCGTSTYLKLRPVATRTVSQSKSRGQQRSKPRRNAKTCSEGKMHPSPSTRLVRLPLSDASTSPS